MKEVHILSVGKLRDKNLLALENEYLKRIKVFNVIHHELKTHEENLDLESLEVSKKISDIEKTGKAKIFLLAEKGKEFDSPSFSNWLFSNLEETSKNLILVIGGASGHGDKAISLSHGSISLGKLTFPHQIARMLLAEQLYRAETIFQSHPYHK